MRHVLLGRVLNSLFSTFYVIEMNTWKACIKDRNIKKGFYLFIVYFLNLNACKLYSKIND